MNYLTPASLVREFHILYGIPIRTIPQFDVPEKEKSMDLIREEAQELEEAYANKDLVGMTDAWADLVYVIYSAAITHGVNLDKVLEEVQRSNLSKMGDDGKPIYREDGKVLKGPNYSPPNIERILRNEGYAN